jgi:hypothetical protein
MDFLEFLKSASNLNGGNNKKVIGKVPNSFLREFKDFLDDKDHLHTTYDIRKKQIQLELEQKLKDEFQSRFDMIAERHEFMWGKIYEEFNVDPNGEYSFNPSTNEITQYNDNQNSTSKEYTQ